MYDIDTDKFILTSEFLTGVKGLDTDIAQQYIVRLINAGYFLELASLIDKTIEWGGDGYESADLYLSSLESNESLIDVSKALIYLWYTSTLITKNGEKLAGTQNQYMRALIWTCIDRPSAHGVPYTPVYWKDKP